MFEYLFDIRHIAPVTLIVKALVATSAAAIYYARFRLPFALLLIAAGLVLATIAAASIWTGASISHHILLLCGLLVFAAAMAFDMSDRERVTRRADCAFWLHLLAAPLIVHSLISLVTPTIADMSDQVAAVIIVIVLCLAVVAILIDRRALLVSALVYVGFVVGYALSRSGAPTSTVTNRMFVFSATILILGAFVISLGVGWLPLRRVLLRVLPSFLINRLPPPVPA